MTTFKAFPQTPVPGLSLRGLREQGTDRLKVAVLRVRARLIADPYATDPDAAPLYSFDVPGLNDRAIVAAYAHPFVAGDVALSAPDPAVDDLRVVRPVVAIRGPKTLEIALLDNDSAWWPGVMDGTLDQMPFGEAHHLQEQEAWALPDGKVQHLLTPTRIVTTEEVGASEANPTSETTWKLTLASGATIKADFPNGTDPVVGDPYPGDQEDDRFVSVGDYGRNSQLAFPRRNAYAVPVKEDDPNAAEGPLQQEINPDTVVAVREAVSDPANPTELIQRVTLASGATVRVPIGETVTVGLPLENPSLVIEEAEPIDPNEWWEFDLVLVHKQIGPQEGGNLYDPRLENPSLEHFQSLPGAAIVDGDQPDHLAGINADPWPIFPNCVQAPAESTGGTGGPVI